MQEPTEVDPNFEDQPTQFLRVIEVYYRLTPRPIELSNTQPSPLIDDSGDEIHDLISNLGLPMAPDEVAPVVRNSKNLKYGERIYEEA